MTEVDLSRYDNGWYDPGRGRLIRFLWLIFSIVVFQNRLVFSYGFKVLILRVFGATIGQGVVIKPCVNIKYPWNLKIGDNTWIGEECWLDSLVLIDIGDNVCVSQGSYLCTGNHDWGRSNFGLQTKSIVLENGVWVGAKSILLPGVVMMKNSMVTAGAVLSSATKKNGIYSGNPAAFVKLRTILEY